MRIIVIVSIVFLTNFFQFNRAFAADSLNLSHFMDKAYCFDRENNSHLSVVDSHLHFRPFGGPSIPFQEMTSYLQKAGILFANIYGIGQTLNIDSGCTYYKDCPGVSVTPSIKNDLVNAANYMHYPTDDAHLVLSMTFFDLANPEDIDEMIGVFDKEYPEKFRWAGEVNLVKQALYDNHHEPADKKDIKNWASFMKILRERSAPINIHSDLGSDNNPLEHLGLMEHVLALYPENKVVWAHMGLSKELVSMNPEQHISILSRMLEKYENLYLDLSWRVLEDNYFSKHREVYVSFINNYSDRFIAGTDFVAAATKSYEDYLEDLKATGEINRYIDDEAFSNIALGGNYFKLLNLDFTAPKVCGQ